MIFISLCRFRSKPTKEGLAESQKLFEKMAKEGAKVLGMYWTLGRYDVVVIVEGPDEKVGMRALLRWADMISSETMVAIPAEEARELVE